MEQWKVEEWRRIQRRKEEDEQNSGRGPEEWYRAGEISINRALEEETENSNREGERYRGTRVQGKRNEEGKTISERLRDGERKIGKEKYRQGMKGTVEGKDYREEYIGERGKEKINNWKTKKKKNRN